jgi:hypothetical protein
VTDKLDTGPPPTAEVAAALPRELGPTTVPTVLVFTDVVSLAQSLEVHEHGQPVERGPMATERGMVATPAPPSGANGHTVAALDANAAAFAPAPPHAQVVAPLSPPPPFEALPVAPATPAPPYETLAAPAPVEVVTDEERTRYGLLLDSAAERGLLDPTDYEIRLRELAGATTTAQMVEIVAELPAFAPVPPTSTPTRSRRAIQSDNRAGAAGAAAGQRRRLVMWMLMGLLVVVAVASLIILALSAERLSRSRNSSPPPPPVATQPVSALRL